MLWIDNSDSSSNMSMAMSMDSKSIFIYVSRPKTSSVSSINSFNQLKQYHMEIFLQSPP